MYFTSRTLEEESRRGRGEEKMGRKERRGEEGRRKEGEEGEDGEEGERTGERIKRQTYMHCCMITHISSRW